MRRIVSSLSFFSLIVLLVAALSPTAHATDYSYARIVRLSLVNGDVQINRGGHSGWEQAVANMPIEQGFTLGTTAGRAEVEFEDGATIWIAENTVVQFTELALSDGGRITHLTMGQGTLTVSASLKTADSFTINASKLQMSASKHALFRVDAFRDGASISVLDGSVLIESPSGTKMIQRGQTFAFNTKGPESAALQKNPKPDSWDHWVGGRQLWLAQQSGQANSFAGAPFTYGLADLSAYGAWNYFPGYGYGWQPIGTGNCWSPFMDGAWDFYPGLGWTWVSGEPWGWLPYHFGGWTYSPAYGWMWMPGDFDTWNSAPVNWYDVNNQVAWSPSAMYFTPSQSFLSGLGGFGGCGLAGFGIDGYGPAQRRGVKPASIGPGVRGKHPIGPRFVLTAGKQLGRGGTVRMVAAGSSEANIQALPAPPLENGRFASSSAETNAAVTARVLVPTAGNLNTVRAGLRLAANGSAVTPMKITPAPMPVMASFRNGAPAARLSMPHPPSPIRFSRATPSFGIGTGGRMNSGGSFHGSAPSVSAPHPAAPAAHASSGGGKPH